MSRASDLGREVLQIEANALSRLAERFDAEAFEGAVRLLLETCGRVVVTGMGKSGIISRKLAGTLASTGSPALFLHPAEAGHGDLGMVVEGDVVVAISSSGETKELVAMLPWIKRLGVPLIAIVGEPGSTLAREAAVVLDVGVEKEACPLNMVPTASTTAALAMGDALAMSVLEARGFSVEELAANHPRGNIGQQLLRVQDLMHREAEIPRVDASAGIDEVLAEMTDKSLGMTTVVDDAGCLLGIITDGDLRRLLQSGNDAPGMSAVDWMTTDPVCVRADALATEALRLLEERKITALLVTDADQRPRGVIHLHDLWRTEMI